MSESENPSAEPAEDTMLVALISTTKVTPPPPRDRAKRHRVRYEEESWERKKEHNELETVRRTSLIYEEPAPLEGYRVG